MKIKLSEGGFLPSRAHPWDAGLDLYTPVDVVIPGCKICGGVRGFMVGGAADIGCATIDTLVHVEIPEGYTGFIKSKSGLNVKHGLTCDGVIDAGYTGSIRVKLYNHTRKPYFFKAGDKIAQLVILPCLLPELEVAYYLSPTDRGDGGFGSTGR